MREFCPTDRVVLLCLLILGVFPSHGQAQERKWELEGHAGWSFVGGLSQGVTALPPVGGAFTTPQSGR